MKTGIAGALAIIGLAVALMTGWIMNIIAICGADFSHITGVLVLRVIGIFIAPLGGVMGLFV